MSPTDNSQIAALIDEVRAMRREIAVIHTKLFGDEDKETEQGRIPRLEADVEDLKSKLNHFEPVRILLNGAWMLLVAAFGYLLNHFFPFKGH